MSQRLAKLSYQVNAFGMQALAEIRAMCNVELNVNIACDCERIVSAALEIRLVAGPEIDSYSPLSSSPPNSVGSHFAGNVSRSSQIARSQQSQQRSHPPTLASSDLIFRQFVDAIVVPCCRLICMYLLGCLPNNFPLPDCLSLVDLRHHPASARKNTELS